MLQSFYRSKKVAKIFVLSALDVRVSNTPLELLLPADVPNKANNASVVFEERKMQNKYNSIHW